jgi:hypothetical protein
MILPQLYNKIKGGLKDGKLRNDGKQGMINSKSPSPVKT